MRYDELRKRAEKKVKGKKAFYILATVFGALSVILYVVSLQFWGWAAYWIRLPILIFALVLAIVYVSIFGFAFMDTDWEEEEVEKEIARLSKISPLELPSGEELSEEDKLELKELERLKRKWQDEDDYV